MVAPREQLEHNFVCPKCRNRGALVQDINLGLLFTTRYLAASCALCGYTEFYHAAIFVKASEELPKTVPLAIEKPK